MCSTNCTNIGHVKCFKKIIILPLKLFISLSTNQNQKKYVDFHKNPEGIYLADTSLMLAEVKGLEGGEEIKG